MGVGGADVGVDVGFGGLAGGETVAGVVVAQHVCSEKGRELKGVGGGDAEVFAVTLRGAWKKRRWEEMYMSAYLNNNRRASRSLCGFAGSKRCGGKTYMTEEDCVVTARLWKVGCR